MSTTNLILNQLPRFPAHVSATNGLTTVIENGVDLVIVPDFGSLVPVPAVTNPALTYFMAWDSSIDYYQSISFQDLADNLAGQVLAGTLLALKNVTFAANQGIYFSDANTAHAYDLSSFVRGVSVSADAATFRTGIGLGSVNNTSDAGKPVSTAQQAALDLKQDLAPLAFGQCRLTLSGGNLLLSRHNGRLLTINGLHYVIPASGPTLAATSLTPSTLYYIYAYMNSGTMTLEASTTVPATDATTGIQIKNGDATRSLVGMARPVTGPAWADTIAQRFVRSYYNRDKPRGAGTFTADRATSSTSLVELNSEIRNEFLTWADENIQANFSGWGSTSAGGPAVLKIVLDAAAGDLARCGTNLSTSANMSIAGVTIPGLGYHYVTMYASVSTGSMTIFGTGTAPGLLNTTII